MRGETLHHEFSELERRLRAAESLLGIAPDPATPPTLMKGPATSAEALLMSRQIRSLAIRLQVVEAMLSARGADLPPVSEIPTTPDESELETAPAAESGDGPAESQIDAPKPPLIASVHFVLPTDGQSTTPPQGAPAPTAPTPPFRPFARPLPPREPINLERLIGGRWFAWIGALAVVIGVGLLLKLAYDQHWFRVSPAMRCMTVAAFGLLLVGVGEYTRKKVNVAAAAGILAAGIGTIYASALGAYRLYDLVSDPVGMAMLAAAAVFGIAVGVRARLVSVTAVSLLGGYLAPFLIPGQSNPIVLPAFLIMLMTVGLTVGTILGRKFGALRTLVWWATILIGWAWVKGTGLSHPGLSLPFLGLCWAVFHVELGIRARRATPNPLPTPPLERLHDGRIISTSLSTATWVVVLGVQVLDRLDAPSWYVPATLALLCLGCFTLFCGSLRSLARQPRTETTVFGIGLITQSAALVAVALALALTGRAEVLAGTVLALAALVLGRTLKARPVIIYGLCVLAFTSLRVLVYDSWNGGMADGGTLFHGFMLTQWAAITAWVGICWLIGSRLLHPFITRVWQLTSDTMVAIGIMLLGLSLMHVDSSDWTYAAVTATTALGLAAAGTVRRSGGLSSVAMLVEYVGIILLIATRWCFVTTPRGIELLGLHLEPVAFCLPYVGLMAFGVSRLWPISSKHSAVMRDLGILALVTLTAAALLHTQAVDSSVACVVLATGLVLALPNGKRRSPLLVGAGAVTLTFGTVALITCMWWHDAPLTTLASVRVTPAALVALFGAVCWALWATLALGTPLQRQLATARFGVAAAIILAMASFYHEDTPQSALCLAWLCIAMIPGALRTRKPALALDFFTIAALIPVTLLWVPAYAQRWTPNAAPFVLHPGLGTAALIAAAWWVAMRWYDVMPDRRPDERRTVRVLAAAGIGLLAFASTSLEVARIASGITAEPTVRGAAISIWWGVLAIGLVAGGFAVRYGPARWAGLGILGIAMFKAVFMDLQNVPQLWRIASFIGLGLMMLIVPIVYSKMSFLFDKAGPSPLESPATAEQP